MNRAAAISQLRQNIMASHAHIQKQSVLTERVAADGDIPKMLHAKRLLDTMRDHLRVQMELLCLLAVDTDEAASPPSEA